MTATTIYHLAREGAWKAAEAAGVYDGTPEDRADGFLHFSTAEQVAVSAAKHRAGETDIVLVAVRSADLGGALKWESSRGGALFPHLYGTLAIEHVAWTKPLPLDGDGVHQFPELDR
ncbi:MAG: DUF952 domain-containing protein [Alphaproteobacteria bacterium]|nr:DUF952 domain-containing protein [Alphaproteobacteria bacterium]